MAYPKDACGYIFAIYRKKSTNGPVLYRYALEKLQSYKSYFHIYTDGSKMKEKTASAFYIRNIDKGYSFRLYDDTSIFKAELFAILLSLQWVEHSNLMNILIVTDSLSCAQAVKNNTECSNPAILNEIQSTLRRCIYNGKRIVLLWVPSHVGIYGNEKADKYATYGLNKGDITALPIECHDVYLQIKTHVLKLWQNTWEVSASRHYLQFEPQVSLEIKYCFGNRNQEVTFTRLKFNHTLLNGSRYRVGIHPDGLCDKCFEFSDANHIFFNCIYYQNDQLRITSHIHRNNLYFDIKTVLTNPELQDMCWTLIKNNKIQI